MSGPVPEAWTRLLAHHRAAQVASDQLNDPDATRISRDEATIRYEHAKIGMVVEMNRLSEAHVLGRITLFLSKRERS